MTTLFVTEYFQPFIHGGAEVSILELGIALIKRGVKVHLLTQNYGASATEEIQGISVHRYFSLNKLRNKTDILTPIWQFNPIFWGITLFSIIKISRENKIDVIHCHGLYSLPSSVLASWLLRTPLAVTFRDNQLLCNYGFCLITNQFNRTCNIKDYFLKDFSQYYRIKVKNKSVITLIIQLTQAISGRIRTDILKFFAALAQNRIVSSQAQRRTFAANGFAASVVYNLYPFPPKCPPNNKQGNYVLYATKLSPGKGLDLFLHALPRVFRTHPTSKALIVGNGDKAKYLEICQKKKISNRVEFQSMPSSDDVRKLRSMALLEVVPSIYPESFGRAALEALAAGIPVVVTNRGGLPEIVDSNVGIVVEPNEQNLTVGILQCIKDNKLLRRNIKLKYPHLQKKFYDVPVNETLKIYKTICH